MAKVKGVRWYYDTLTPTLAIFSVAANFAVHAEAKALAARIEAWMKQNAPWEDRTGAARAGLTAEVESAGFRQDIWIYHTVDYGIWLEVRWDGAYAIIQPTLDHFSSEWGSGLTELLTGMNVKASYEGGGAAIEGGGSGGGDASLVD